MRIARAHLLPWLLAALASAGSAAAGAPSGQLEVRVQVELRCTVGASSLDFGTYVLGQKAALQAEGAIVYEDCPAGKLTIELDGGASGKTNARRLSDGADGSLDYQLYTNAKRSKVWGDGRNAYTVTASADGSGSVAVFGTIPGGQRPEPGTFSDIVNVTLAF